MTSEGTGAVHVRERNRWGEGKRLRAEILAAARQLLCDLGAVEGLTLRGVARHAGIAPASIYAHFSDKSRLVDALLDHESARLLALMAEAAAAVPAGPGETTARLRAAMHAFCGYALASRGFYRVLLNLCVDRGDGTRTVIGELESGLAACLRAGTRLRLPVERAAIVLVTAAHGRVALSSALTEPTTETEVLDFADDLIALVIDGTVPA